MFWVGGRIRTGDHRITCSLLRHSSRNSSALQGRHIIPFVHCIHLFRPFRAQSLLRPEPGALPRAIHVVPRWGTSHFLSRTQGGARVRTFALGYFSVGPSALLRRQGLEKRFPAALPTELLQPCFGSEAGLEPATGGSM